MHSHCFSSTSDDDKGGIKTVPSKAAPLQHGSVYGVDDCQLRQRSTRKLEFQSDGDLARKGLPLYRQAYYTLADQALV